MKPTALNKSYYPSLDGLRGIAILLVLACHNFNFVPSFKSMWIGVDLFFVLSGFLITEILLSTREQKNFLQNFYIRRILRIFPLYYFVLILFFVFVPFISQLAEQYKYYHDNLGMTWFHMINWLYIFNHRPEDSMVFSHLWSLSVEEQFYILWPFLLLLIKNIRKLRNTIYVILATGIILRLMSWIVWGGSYTGFTFHYMTRFDGLCIGSLVAVWKFENWELLKKRFFRFSLTIAAAYVIVLVLSKTILQGLPQFMLFGYTLITTAFGFLLIYSINDKSTVLNRFLKNRVLTYIGKISYGIYVFHWPVFLLIRSISVNPLIARGCSGAMAQFIVASIAFTLTILISMFSHHVIEQRILALKYVLTEDGFFVRLRQRVILWMKPASAK